MRSGRGLGWLPEKMGKTLSYRREVFRLGFRQGYTVGKIASSQGHIKSFDDYLSAQKGIKEYGFVLAFVVTIQEEQPFFLLSFL
jgi:hypothetical protein